MQKIEFQHVLNANIVALKKKKITSALELEPDLKVAPNLICV